MLYRRTNSRYDRSLSVENLSFIFVLVVTGNVTHSQINLSAKLREDHMKSIKDSVNDKWRNRRLTSKVFVLIAASALVTSASCESVMAAGTIPAPSAAETQSFIKVASHNDYKYRRVVKNGVEYFCQKEAVTGTHLQRNDICYTKEQMKKMEEASQAATRDMQKPAYDGTAQNNGAGT